MALEIATAYEQLQESCATFKSATRPSEEQKHSGSGQHIQPSLSTGRHVRHEGEKQTCYGGLLHARRRLESHMSKT